MKNKRKLEKPCGCISNEYYAKERNYLLDRTLLSKIKFTKIAVVFLLITQICLSIAIGIKSNIINVMQATKWQSTGKSSVSQTANKTSKVYENEPKIKIVAEKPQWSNELASVKLQIIGDLSEGANPQYGIDGTNDWKPYNSEEENIITGLKHKQIIAVKIYNENTKVTKTSYIHVKDEKEPQKATTTLTNYETTAKSVINIPVIQTDNESGIDIEKCKWVYNNISTQIGTNEADYTGGSFSSNPQTIQVECNTAGNYYMHVLSVDKAGNKTETVLKPIKVSVGAATEGLKQGNIIATAPIWNNGKAEITLNTHTGLNIQWQKNTINGTWQEENTITDLQHGDSVFARLVDENGNVGQYASVSILDGNAPNTAVISLEQTQEYPDDPTTITATVTHSDNEIGIDIEKCKWVYNTISTPIGTNEADYTGGSFSSNTQAINLTANTEGTYYLHVLSVDKAGNKIETISESVISEIVFVIWDDEGYEDLRPDSIHIRLRKNAEPYFITITSENEWKYVWQKLDTDEIWTIEYIIADPDHPCTIARQGNNWVITVTYEPLAIPDEPIPE